MLVTIVVSILQAIIALGVSRAMWFSLLRWRIEVYGRFEFARMQEVGFRRDGMPPEVRRTALYRYVFAIRNGESDVLDVPLACEIALEKTGTRFVEGPTLSCGFASRFAGQRIAYRRKARDPDSEVIKRVGPIRQVYELDVEELRGGDTWIITFVSDASSRHVSFRVRPVTVFEGADMLIPVVEPVELKFQPNQSVTSKEPSGDRWVPMSMVFLCALVYLWLVGHMGYQAASEFPDLRKKLELFDLLTTVLTLALVWWLWRLTKRVPAPFIQGYRSTHETAPPS